MNKDTEITQAPPSVVLTEEQEKAVELILQFAHDTSYAKTEFKLGGYAGTGKTTVLKFLREKLREGGIFSIVSAFTGKAVNVLERKKITAQTLHSLMYKVEQIKNQLVFHKRDKLEENPDVIIVDESSMISKDLLDDLRSFGKKLLFVGDPGQLEPVGDNPNLMANPDFVLSKIHRQAEKSPIITLANQVRTGGPVSMHFIGAGEVSDGELLIRDKAISTGTLVEITQTICAKNKTRTNMNEKVRLSKHLAPKTIVPGEKIIVLRNNRDFGVFNGMILFVDEITDDRPICWFTDCHDEIGNKFSDLPIWKLPFQEPEHPTIKGNKAPVIPRLPTKEKSQLVYCDYGYVITCHKSQGSEWDSVLVFDEWVPPHLWDMKKWRYTAITRAAKKLVYCL